MDELLQHCLRELAFDGDLGCNVSRLRDFVCEFYSSRNSVHQTLDDTYYAFIWSLIVQHPSVRVGLLPDGQTADVYIPPQPRASKKAKGAQDDVPMQGPMQGPMNASLVLIPDASRYSLNELFRIYGDRLRIAVESQACFVAVTGSHAKPAKLTPMVYAALQIIARSRESGISVLELGKATGYDQKTCFYLVKQLLDLDLVVKLRRGGNSQNFCVHKYFFDRSPAWKKVREEERRAQEEYTEDGQAEDVAGGAGTGSFQLPHFEPIDTRHLTSLNILRQRLIKLLKYSPDGVQPYTNISVKIGFHPRSRTERRFFIARLNELISEGIIEKFFTPSSNPDTTQNKQLYLRLTSSTKPRQLPADNIPKIPDDEEEMIDNLVTEDRTAQIQIKSTVSLHRQIIDLLKDSSTSGATLNELSDRLDSFDKKTLELLISRMERQAPPTHLADLSVIQVLETHGRERRYRFFTLGGYSELMKREGFEQPSSSYSSEDVAKAGGFMEYRESDFYDSHGDLQTFYKKWNGSRVHRFRVSNSESHRKSPGSTRSTSVQVGSVASRASPKKWTNPILPDGTRKRGRPSKNPDGAEKRAPKRAKNGSQGDARANPIEVKDQGTLGEEVAPTPGRAESTKRKRDETDPENVESRTVDVQGVANSSDIVPKRKRGRPPKKKRVEIADIVSYMGSASSQPEESLPLIPEAPSARTIDSASILEVPSPSASQSITASNTLAQPTPNSELQVPSRISDLTNDTALAVSSPMLPPSLSGISAPYRPSGLPDIPDVSRDLLPANVTPQTYESHARVLPMVSCPQGGVVSSSDDRQPRSAMQLDSLSSIQGDSFGSTRQPQITDDLNREVTRVIASLAAQVNASFSSDSPNTRENAVTGHPDFANLTFNVTVPVSGEPEEICGGQEDTEEVEIGKSIEGKHLGAARPESWAQNPSDVSVARVPKSTEDVTASAMTSIKKLRLTGRHERKTNLSAMRRENELVQLVENAGGILNTSTAEFLTAYMKLIEATVKAGEAASAPIGARSDRRTLNYALDKLEMSGRIKTITTNIPSVTGISRNAKIAYLPTITEENVRTWLSMQGLAESFLLQQDRVPERPNGAEVDSDSPRGLAKQWLHSKDAHEVYQERWHRNAQRAEQLFSQTDAVVREAMLMEKQTLSQLYGYLTGKVMRARVLHLFIIEQFECKVNSPFIVSHEERIVDCAFFENDISLATHCACVTASSFVPNIKNALETEGGRSRLIRDVPDDWKQALQIGRARSRDRIFDLLEYLHSLGVVVPLRRTEHSDSSGDASGRSVPISFEAMPFDWASKVPLIRPEYWKFCTNVPVYLFSLQKDPAPCWKVVPAVSRPDAEQYWAELKASCLNKTFVESARQVSMALDKSYGGEQRVATALRRSSSWAADYTLSWYQTQYLKRFVNSYNGNTPLEDQDSAEARLQNISNVIHAPPEATRKYFLSAHETALRELDKKKRRETQEKLEKKEADMKLLLAHKKLEAVKNREAAWDAMVEKVHPGLVKGVAATRLRKLRQSYVQGNVIQDNHHWELQISDAIRAAKKMRSSRKLFPNVFQAARAHALQKQPEIDASHFPRAAQGKSVETLVNMQENLAEEGAEPENGDTREGQQRARGRKGKGKERARRQRFQWTADYDELARDAYVILRSRCRGHYRLEWAALDQVFPSVSRSSVRARVLMLKEQPGAVAYLQRLENCWHELWVKKRGTPELPDPNPRNPMEFDLKSHLQYLRKYVDKNAIRVGVSALEETEYTPLPANLGDLFSSWNLEERGSPRAGWDFLSNSTIGEETREKLFLEAAFIEEADDVISEDPQPDVVHFAEAALKMVAGTPDELYNASDAATLLHGVGEDEISTAMDNLLSCNVLSKLVRDPTRLVPGRTVKISEINQNALGGSIGRDAFVDASQLDESYEIAKDEWREWPLTSTDGDTAALLQRFSDHHVEFDVSTSHAQAARAAIDGNSRKVDDDDIELGLQVKLSGPAIPEIEPASTEDEQSPIEPEDASDHGTSISGEQACCSLRSSGVVDCLKCIEEARAQMSDWSESDRSTTETIIQLAERREKDGIKIEELKTLVDARDDAFTSVIHRLHSLHIPLLHLTGYSSTVAVFAKYVGAWAVTLPGENVPLSKVFPRRWLDLTGGRVMMVWEAGLRAVIGLLHLRPGISQAELRWRLRAVYDRQEVFDLLNHLVSSGILKIFRHGDWQSPNCVCVDALSKEEEKAVFWAIREEKRWYRNC